MVASAKNSRALEGTKDESGGNKAAEATVVDQRRTLLPPEILITGEYPLYETRPLLWPLLIRPGLVAVVGIIIMVIAPQLQLEFIHAIAEEIPLNPIRLFILWFGVALLVIGLFRILGRVLRWRNTVYTVTNRRLLRQTGIVGKSYVDCSLRRVQNVFMDVTILGRIFGFGTIRVATAGVAGIEIYWKNVREPLKVHRELNEAIEQYMRENGRSEKGEL
jgi:uncharacterized membrane protein YdbT with pleckstrin-like domain